MSQRDHTNSDRTSSRPRTGAGPHCSGSSTRSGGSNCGKNRAKSGRSSNPNAISWYAIWRWAIR